MRQLVNEIAEESYSDVDYRLIHAANNLVPFSGQKSVKMNILAFLVSINAEDLHNSTSSPSKASFSCSSFTAGTKIVKSTLIFPGNPAKSTV